MLLKNYLFSLSHAQVREVFAFLSRTSTYTTGLLAPILLAHSLPTTNFSYVLFRFKTKLKYNGKSLK